MTKQKFKNLSLEALRKIVFYSLFQFFCRNQPHSQLGNKQSNKTRSLSVCGLIPETYEQRHIKLYLFHEVTPPRSAFNFVHTHNQIKCIYLKWQEMVLNSQFSLKAKTQRKWIQRGRRMDFHGRFTVVIRLENCIGKSEKNRCCHKFIHSEKFLFNFD